MVQRLGGWRHDRIRDRWGADVTDRLESRLDPAGLLSPQAYRDDFDTWWDHLGGAV